MSTSQPIVDTPDFQSGVVSAQKVLAVVPAGTTTATVRLPPNAETLVIISEQPNSISTISVTGVGSGVSFPLSGVQAPQGSGNSPTWYADVSSAVDTQVKVTLDMPIASNWWVYSDSGVHMVADTNKAVNNQRVQYMIGIPPDTGGGDHPYNELQVESAVPTINAVILGPAGAGQRYRIFSAQMIVFSGTPQAYLYDTGTGIAFIGTSVSGGGNMQYPPSGLPLSINASINYVVYAGSGQCFVVIVYTNEKV